MAGNDLIVMNYNTQWWSGRKANIKMQEEILSKYHPDLIGLQEFREYIPGSSSTTDTSGTPVWPLLFKDYKYTHTIKKGNENYKAFASKLPFDHLYEDAYIHQDKEQRGYARVYLNIDNKR